MTTLAELCQTKPEPTGGVPIGVGEWRFIVEMLLPRATGFVEFNGTAGNYLSVVGVDHVPAAGVLPQFIIATARIHVDDLASENTIVAKWGAAGNRSWWFGLNGDGDPMVKWSANGTDELSAVASTPLSSGFTGWVRWNVSWSFPAQAIFLTSLDGSTWTVHDTVSFTSSSVFTGTAPVTIGADAAGDDPFEGWVGQVEVGGGRGTVLLVEFDPATEPDAASITAATGQTVSAVRTADENLVFGGSHSRWQGLFSDGETKWGSATWTGRRWKDITRYVRGVSWTRGANAPGDRPRVDAAHLTLDARAAFDPLDLDGSFGTYSIGAGTIIRAGLVNPTGPLPRALVDDDGNFLVDDDDNVLITDPGESDGHDWLPQFTVITELWEPTYEAAGRERRVEVTGVGTMSLLASVDNNALVRPIKPESPAARFQRLLDRAGWKYGLINASYTFRQDWANNYYTLLGTNMAENRLAELYLTADSVGLEIWSDRTGAARIAERGQAENDIVPFGTDSAEWYRLFPLRSFSVASNGLSYIGLADREGIGRGGIVYGAYREDGFKAWEDVTVIENDFEVGVRGSDTEEGGARYRTKNRASIGKWGRRVHNRYDLLSEPGLELVGSRLKLYRSLTAIVMQDVTMYLNDHSEQTWLAFCALDIGCRVDVLPPGQEIPVADSDTGVDQLLRGYVSRLTHRVTPLGSESVFWTVDVGVDVVFARRWQPGAYQPDF